MKYIITESQRHTLLVETLSPTIRRRLTFENMKNEVDSIIEYELNPCDFKTVGNFIVDVCDIFTYNFLEDLQASANDKDGLYYYAVDVFGKYLAEIYNEKCGKKNMMTESKLDQVIYDYLDELFAAENGNTEIYKLEVFSTQPENRNEPIEGQYDFVNDDYYETNDQEYIFSWTGKEYYESITPNYITQDEMEKFSKKTPIVEILNHNIVKQLDSYFGDLWKPAFKKWFVDKTEMDYKTLYTE